jgi:hypothetical protein
MWRKAAFAFLVVAATFLLAGCIGGGGGGPTVVDRAIAWISGVVSKFRGEPILGATVTLKETGQSTRTESDGRFVLETSYRGAATLRAEAPGYLSLEWPVDVTDSGASIHLRLVSMSDYDARLFSILTTATDTGGTMRWANGSVHYFIDRNAPWRPEFDPVLREAFTQWSMATRRAITFAEGDAGAPLRITFVSGNPCGYAGAAGCGGPTGLSADGTITNAKIELVAGYATSIDLALHEVGHTLSLLGHSSNTTDVMYYRMNNAQSPSNAEAAVAAVLYANPPGATMREIRLPAAVAQAAPAPAPPAAWVSSASQALAATGGPAGISGGGLNWWSELLCRFAILAPLCEGTPPAPFGL